MSNSTLSVRLGAEVMESYRNIIESAGLTTSQHTRSLVENTLNSIGKLKLEDMKIDFKPSWVDSDKRFYSEYCGVVVVNVTPPSGMTLDDLSRLVFIIPEFFEEDRELFRIDSHHYHRVTAETHFIESSKMKRCVLSFRMIKGKWHVGFYNYSHLDKTPEFMTMMEERVKAMITNTIALFLLGQLPQSRILDLAQVQKEDEISRSSGSFQHVDL